jgi:hypothetical protein
MPLQQIGSSAANIRERSILHFRLPYAQIDPKFPYSSVTPCQPVQADLNFWTPSGRMARYLS